MEGQGTLRSRRQPGLGSRKGHRPHCACHSSRLQFSAHPCRGSQLGYRQQVTWGVWCVIQTRLPLPTLCLAVSLLKGLVVLGQARETVIVTSTKEGLAMVTSLTSECGGDILRVVVGDGL